MTPNRRPPLKRSKEGHEDWLMSYADMITLLLTFFVLLLTISHIDPVKYEQVKDGLARDIAKRESLTPIEQLRTDLNQDIKELNLTEEQMSVGVDDRGIVLDLDAGTFFETGSAKLKPQSFVVLKQIHKTLSNQVYDGFQIEAQGHTDDMPIAPGAAFPSNWELSGARASAVVRLFIDWGMAAPRLAAVGFAETRPKLPNRDLNGAPLPRNQMINRRVAVHIYAR